MTLEVGTTLYNRYRITGILGQGGMGAVYRAMDENLDLDVAVKENLFLSDEFARQFRREATVLATLRFNNLPRVIDHFIIPGQGQYLVMDFIAGEDLRQRMERVGTLSEEEVIRIGIAICDGLNYLHTRSSSIVHRDVKPGNVKITPDGQIVLVDFGLVKVMSGSQTTTTGARAMTPGYSPPEQYGTARTEPRSDIYSLAATLYVALTGVIPEDSLARATGNAELTPLRKINSKISRRLAVTIEKGLALEVDERHQSALDFKEALMNCSTSNRSSFTGEITITPAPISAENQNRQAPFTEPPSAESLPMGWGGGKSISRTRQERRRRQRLLIAAAFSVLIGIIVYGLLTNYYPPLPQAIQAALNLATNTPMVTEDRQHMTVTPGYSTANGQTPAGIGSDEVTLTPDIAGSLTLTPTPLGGGNGDIAFVSTRTGTPQIWLMSMDGNNQRQFTNAPDGACQPDWSPDGEQIVFTSPCRSSDFEFKGTSLYIINIDGSGLTPLPVVPGGDFDPAWSPDGNRIAFTSLRDGYQQVYIYNLVDRLSTRLSDDAYPDSEPAWSPSGTQIAFIRKKGNQQVFIMSDNGDNQILLSMSGNVNNTAPVWSPDGQAIFFTQTLSNKISRLASIRYEDRFNHKENRIPPNPKPDLGPVVDAKFSPDGFWLIYESWPDGRNHDIYIMTAAGANPRRLTTDPSYDFDPVWRPLTYTP